MAFMLQASGVSHLAFWEDAQLKQQLREGLGLGQ